MELLGAVFHEVENGLFCDLVGSPEIFVEGRGADPSEGAESELEDVAQDVYDVGRVPELVAAALFSQDIGAGS